METLPVVVDLVARTMVRVGEDPQAQEQYEQLIAEQRKLVSAGSAGSSH